MIGLDGTERHNCREAVRHLGRGVERSASAHAVAGHVDAVWINAVAPRHVVEDRAQRVDIGPDFAFVTLGRDHNERKVGIGFDFLGSPNFFIWLMSSPRTDPPWR